MRVALWAVASATLILLVSQSAATSPSLVLDPFYYELLGVDIGASAVELKKGYRRQAIMFHPDKHPHDKGMELRFQVVSQAWHERWNNLAHNHHCQISEAYHGKSTVFAVCLH